MFNLISRSGCDRRRFNSLFPVSLGHVAFDLTRTHTHTHTELYSVVDNKYFTMSRASPLNCCVCVCLFVDES